MSTIISSAASSAAPAGTPAPVVPPPTAAPAPSANAADPTKLEYYDHKAAESILAAATAPSGAATAPVATGQEPAPVAPNAQPAALEAPAAPVQPTGQEDEIADPTAEELAVLNEPGQRALMAERQKRKDARTENLALKAELAELKKAPAAPVVPDPAKPPQPQPAAVSTPSVATPALADCQTFEAVEARAVSAAETEAQVIGLQTQLQRQGAEAVAAKLTELGVKQIGEVPVAEATPEAIGDFLQTALNGARMTQTQAAPRKRFLESQNQSWNAAAKILPEMNDMNSATHKAIAGLVKANPTVTQYPNWPQIAVKLYLGEQAFNKLAAPAPAAPAKAAAIVPAPSTVPAPVVPALRSAPGAPAISGAAQPASKRMDELSAKLQNGTATMAEVDEYGRRSVSV